MERLDFCTVSQIIKDYCNEELYGTQLDYVEKLFHTCVYGEEDDIIYFDDSQVCRWLKGQVCVSRTITSYYLNSEEHREHLAEDIENYILAIMYDKEMALIKLRELLLNDTSISDSKKQVLDSYYNTDSDNGMAAFISILLLFAMERKFIKRDTEKKLITSGELSPVISDYIFENDPPTPCRYFCGRDKEIEELHGLLTDKKKIFLSGIAGIGKSELAKAYAKRYKKEYTNILYITYSGNLTEDIAGLDFADDLPNKTESERLKKHNRFLRSLKDDTLIIIDNFDTASDSDSYLSVIMKYRCRILFTTRSRFEHYDTYELNEIRDTNELLSLADKFYNDFSSDKDTALEIIETVHHHTFAVELAARLLQKGILTQKELLNKLKEENVRLSSADMVSMKKDGILRKDSYYGHISTLFSLSVLGTQEKYIMRCMCLVPDTGIHELLFAEWTNQSDMNTINTLIELGLIKEQPLRKISLHPMIQEITVADLKPSVTNCNEMLEYIHDKIFIMLGMDIPFATTLFETVTTIIDLIYKDDIDGYISFIQDAFPYMESYKYKSGMYKIINELDSLSNDKENRHLIAPSLLYGYKAAVKQYFENDTDGAYNYSKKAIQSLPDLNKDTALLYSNTYCNHGELEHLKGNYDTAMQYLENALLILDDYNLDYTNAIIVQAVTYAVLLSDSGEKTKALNILKKCKKIVKTHNSEICHDFAEIEETAAYIYLSMGDTNKARVHYKKAISIYNIIWEEHPELIEDKINMLKQAIISQVPNPSYFIDAIFK